MRLGKAYAMLGMAGLIGLIPCVSEGAAAKRAGGSGFSGTLASNPALRQQQLACDPDDPIVGSTSVEYDPLVSRLVGFGMGPGYSGGAFVEVRQFNPDTESVITVFQPINAFLASPAGAETGYVQTFYTQIGDTGQVQFFENYNVVDHAGPESVDTHYLLFADGHPDGPTPSGQTFDTAIYRVFADPGTHGGNPSDFMVGQDANGAFVVTADQIADAVVQAPEPTSLALVGVGAAALLRRRRAQA